MKTFFFFLLLGAGLTARAQYANFPAATTPGDADLLLADQASNSTSYVHMSLASLKGYALAQFAPATGKTFTFANTLTLAGTDGSTLNIGGGGTLGSAAFAPTSAFAPANVVYMSCPVSLPSDYANYLFVDAQIPTVAVISNYAGSTVNVSGNVSIGLDGDPTGNYNSYGSSIGLAGTMQSLTVAAIDTCVAGSAASVNANGTGVNVSLVSGSSIPTATLTVNDQSPPHLGAFVYFTTNQASALAVSVVIQNGYPETTFSGGFTGIQVLAFNVTAFTLSSVVTYGSFLGGTINLSLGNATTTVTLCDWSGGGQGYASGQCGVYAQLSNTTAFALNLPSQLNRPTGQQASDTFYGKLSVAQVDALLALEAASNPTSGGSVLIGGFAAAPDAAGLASAATLTAAGTTVTHN